jgi:hypothetical protein
MSMDLVHHVEVVEDVIPGAALATFAGGVAIDTAGYESLMFGIVSGAMAFTATDKLTWTVQESDTTTAGDFVDVATTDYIGAYVSGVSGWDRIMDAAGDASSVFTIGVRMNTKRYKRLVPTEGGTVSVVLATWAMLSHARSQPV